MARGGSPLRWGRVLSPAGSAVRPLRQSFRHMTWRTRQSLWRALADPGGRRPPSAPPVPARAAAAGDTACPRLARERLRGLSLGHAMPPAASRLAIWRERVTRDRSREGRRRRVPRATDPRQAPFPSESAEAGPVPSVNALTLRAGACYGKTLFRAPNKIPTWPRWAEARAAQGTRRKTY